MCGVSEVERTEWVEFALLRLRRVCRSLRWSIVGESRSVTLGGYTVSLLRQGRRCRVRLMRDRVNLPDQPWGLWAACGVAGSLSAVCDRLREWAEADDRSVAA